MILDRFYILNFQDMFLTGATFNQKIRNNIIIYKGKHWGV